MAKPTWCATGSRTMPPWMDIGTGRRVVIVGADGFIGSAVAGAALSAGAAVTAVCVKSPWRLQPLEGDPALSIVPVPGGRWWTASFIRELQGRLERADSMVLLAYQPPPSRAGAARHEHAVNLAGTVRWGRAASRATTPAVFTSSADVYGPWRQEPVDESAPPAPTTHYAVAKLEAEHRLLRLLGPSGLTVLRISTVFGPGEDRPRAIPAFIKAFLDREEPVLHRGGTDVRDYVNVDDVAAAIVNACLRRTEASTMNVGSGVGRSTRDVLDSVARVMGVEAEAGSERVAPPWSRLVLDAGLARRELGFQPRSDFEGALLDEIRWLEERRTGVAA